MERFEGLVFGEERALYGITDADVRFCAFKGEADGESALKECADLKIEECDFHLRYPMWHLKHSEINSCRLHEGCRAPLWYCDGVNISNTKINGVKAIRECADTEITDCDLTSSEACWFCRGIHIRNSEIKSEYPFLKSADMLLEKVRLDGKYSFQYVENAEIKNCILNTKDAFWHSKNVTVTDSVVNGEYLGWYSEGLTLVRCKITGTQPLCYCKSLTLVDCEMQDSVLSFERSEVKASVSGAIESVKNPISGYIEADGIGEIILDIPSECKIKVR